MKIPEKYLDALSIAFMAVTAAVTILVVMLTDRPADEVPEVPELTFTESEISLVESADSVMRVLTIADSLDLKVLRARSAGLSEADLRSETFGRLAGLMLSTVTSPEQDGVGIGHAIHDLLAQELSCALRELLGVAGLGAVEK